MTSNIENLESPSCGHSEPKCKHCGAVDEFYAEAHPTVVRADAALWVFTQEVQISRILCSNCGSVVQEYKYDEPPLVERA